MLYSKMQKLYLALTLVMLCSIPRLHSATNMAPPPPPPLQCLVEYKLMEDCYYYYSMRSNQSKPTAECCSELKAMLKSYPYCFCEIYDCVYCLLDADKILSLPSECGVPSPSSSNCSKAPPPPPPPPPPPTMAVGVNNGSLGSSGSPFNLSMPTKIAIAIGTFAAIIIVAIIAKILRKRASQKKQSSEELINNHQSHH